MYARRCVLHTIGCGPGAVSAMRPAAGLATVVGVLVEVPLMLSRVRSVNACKPWYEARRNV